MGAQLRHLGLAAFFFIVGSGIALGQWVSNACPGVTITSTTSSGMSGQPDCATISAVLLPGGWDGGSGSGFIRYNWVSAISSVRIEFFSVNTNDYATISTNTGGSLTITSVGSCSNVVGNVVGPYLGGGSFGTVAYNVSSTIPFTQLQMNNTGASSGWVCDCPVNVILATELDFFHAQFDGEGEVNIDWQSSHESNASHYVVERSLDAVAWEALGDVTAAGNSNSPVAYHYTDRMPLSGKSMYRLRSVDVDGEYTQSGVETVIVDDYIKVVPSMSSTAVQVLGLTDAAAIKVYNHLGMAFDVPMTASAAGLRLDISQLQGGLYILRLQTPDKMLSRKIWKL